MNFEDKIFKELDKLKTKNGWFWKKVKNNHKIILKWLFIKKNYKNITDWYNIKKKDFINYKIRGLLRNFYKGSIQICITTSYPELYVWLFNIKIIPNNYWSDYNNEIKALKWLGEKLGYIKKEDWYKIKTSDYVNNNLRSLLHKYKDSPIIPIITIFKLI